MSRNPRSRRQFRFPGGTRPEAADDLDDELRFHLEQVAEELRSEGWSESDAVHEAARRFGDLEYTRNYCRDQDRRRVQEQRRMNLLGEFGQDLRYAMRSLRSAPGFTAVALVTLALGIGANTAIFSVVRGVLLEPLPFHEPDRIVRVWHARPSDGIENGRVSEPDFLDWRRTSTKAESMGGYFYVGGLSGIDLTGNGHPERISSAAVTDGFFETLGTPAMLGRALTAEDHAPGRGGLSLVISHGLWTRRFGADPEIVGRTLTLDTEPFEVVGVMPPGFVYPADQGIDGWIPLSFFTEDDIGRERASQFLAVIARPKPGVTAGALRTELSGIAAQLAQIHPDNPGWTAVTVESLRESIFGDVQRPLVVLLVAVGMLLLIACVNIANLMLARASSRQRELAVRAALGAGPARIARQLLTESLTLAVLGGALGAGLAYLAVGVIAAAGASELPRAGDIRIDGVVLGFTIGASILSGLLFGIVPTIQSVRPDLENSLRAGARGSVGGAGHRLRSALVVAEVALAVVLVVGAALATKSFARLEAVNPGFDIENALVATASVPERLTTPESKRTHYRSMLDAIRAVPGVRAVGAIRDLPLRANGETTRLDIPGRGTAPGEGPEVQLHQVSAEYFEAMGIPLRSGRAFGSGDHLEAKPVVIVNEELAQRYWPGEEAVGKIVGLGEDEAPIVGVVGNVRQRGLAEPYEPAMYLHAMQYHRSRMSIVIRTQGDPLLLAEAVRRAIWSLDPSQSITDVSTLESVLGNAVARPRLLAWMLSAFGVIGLALGAVGIFGVLAYAVNQRRQEIGVRIALGASPASVLKLVVGRGMLLTGAGVVVGVAGAAMLTRSMQSVLFGIRPLDPATFVQVILVILGAALLASWLPARRALGIDPITALRYE